jgi:hypothetical protein
LREEESEQDANCERNATKFKIDEKQAMENASQRPESGGCRTIKDDNGA